MVTISAVLSVFNEEKKIEKVLKSLDFADEIIVVDNKSTDRTVLIAKKLGAKVYSRENNFMLNTNKNFGFSKAHCDWIFNLDGDEYVEQNTKEEILKAIRTESAFNGYFLPRKNIIFGKWIRHSLWWPDYQLRLFRRSKGKFPCEHIHEYLKVEGDVGYLTNPFTHENYENVSQFLYKLDKIYTENEVELFIKSGKKLNWFDALGWPIEDFLKTFFAQKGYLDGLHGLVLSLLQAFYQEIKFIKIWEKQKFKVNEPDNMLFSFLSQLKKHIKDFRYWQFTSLYESEKSPLKKNLFRVRRKINL